MSQGQRAGAFTPTHTLALLGVVTKLTGALLSGGAPQTPSSFKEASPHNQIRGFKTSHTVTRR